ncbi:MAG: phosphatase PAP2 family protein [Deltaproteobacteria bacterium]|nr:phosphatase PAP2 family protein [Deltaproteobacteria bacterium]
MHIQFRYCPLLILMMLCLWNSSAHGNTVSPEQDVNIPYALSPVKDISLSSIALSLTVTGLFMAYSNDDITPAEVMNLNADSINRFDRGATHHWSPASAALSNVGAIVSGTIPLLYVLQQVTTHQKRTGLTVLVMYAEAMGITVGLTNIVKGAVRRDRPFLYNTRLSVDQRATEIDPRTSFFSAHSSIAFCSATFFSTVFFRLHPQSRWRFAILSGTLTLAGATAMLRYTAGKHFPTDILTGVAVGTLTGFIIPAAHHSRSRAFAVYPLNGSVKGIGATISF